MSLIIQGVSIQLGEFHLHDVSCEVGAGEYFCILGPTGAGKSILIECVAGLHQPTRGRILLDGRDVTGLAPEERGIGYVPQDYALFPNMTVKANIAFGLRVRHTPPAEIEERADALVKLLGIGHLLDRHPLNLSGGEKQRVALARALAVRPSLLLLDEPLAAVDERTRDRLCAELRAIQRATGVTVIHISHSFDETLAVADRIGILSAGRMMQVGTPEEIFSAPRSRFVAEFTRSENVLPVTGAPREDEGWLYLPVGEGDEIVCRAPAGQCTPQWVVIRPEAVAVLPADAPIGEGEGPRSAFSATVAGLTDRGPLVHLDVRTEAGLALGALRLRSEVRAAGLAPGDRVRVAIEPADVHLLSEGDSPA